MTDVIEKPTTSPISTTRHGDVLIVTSNNPPVNALSAGVPEGIATAIARAGADPAVQAIIVMGAGKTFIAGADISSLEEAAWGRLEAACDMHALLTTIEDSPKPVVMAIHGTALGIGERTGNTCMELLIANLRPSKAEASRAVLDRYRAVSARILGLRGRACYDERQ